MKAASAGRIADATAKPSLGVRLFAVLRDGELLSRVTGDSADQLVSLGWAERVGTGSRLYLRLTDRAPVSALGWASSGGLRRIRADASCQREKGQFIGDPRTGLEFRPV